MVSRPSTACKAAGVCTRGGSLLGCEREQIPDFCGDKEAVLGLEFRAGGTRNRKGGVEASWVEEEGDYRCFGCFVEGSDRQSRR